MIFPPAKFTEVFEVATVYDFVVDPRRDSPSLDNDKAAVCGFF